MPSSLGFDLVQIPIFPALNLSEDTGKYLVPWESRQDPYKKFWNGWQRKLSTAGPKRLCSI